MDDWWKSLTYFESFYYLVAALSIALTLILAAMVFLGVDKTMRRIESSDGEPFRTVRILSFPTLNAYLLGLGWGGIFCMSIGLQLIVVILLSNCLGFILMVLIYFLIMTISGLHETRRVDNNMALGEISEVISTIPANRNGRGRINVRIGSQLMTFDAETNSQSSFKPGDQARVVERVAEAVFLVKEK